MPKEPENLVLKMLCEMRAVQDKQAADTSAQSAGFAVHANVAVKDVRAELQAMDKGLKKLEKRAH